MESEIKIRRGEFAHHMKRNNGEEDYRGRH